MGEKSIMSNQYQDGNELRPSDFILKHCEDVRRRRAETAAWKLTEKALRTLEHVIDHGEPRERHAAARTLAVVCAELLGDEKRLDRLDVASFNDGSRSQFGMNHHTTTSKPSAR
jgi:plasmid stabilization system protein ParE